MRELTSFNNIRKPSLESPVKTIRLMKNKAIKSKKILKVFVIIPLPLLSQNNFLTISYVIDWQDYHSH